MPSHRIVCTDQVPANESHNHAHIVSVGIDTDSDGAANERYTLSQVLTKMDDNEVFYTIGEKSGQRVKVEDVYCCGRRYIRTRPTMSKTTTSIVFEAVNGLRNLFLFPLSYV